MIENNNYISHIITELILTILPLERRERGVRIINKSDLTDKILIFGGPRPPEVKSFKMAQSPYAN